MASDLQLDTCIMYLSQIGLAKALSLSGMLNLPGTDANVT